MSSIPEEKQKIIDGLMNYSLRPYAEANGIPLNDLILQLYEYHNNVLVEQYKKGQIEEISDNEETIHATPVKKGRVDLKYPQPRGRPKKGHSWDNMQGKWIPKALVLNNGKAVSKPTKKTSLA